MGRFGHYTLIPARDAVEGVAHVWVPYTREQIRRAPRIDPNAPLTAATERELLDPLRDRGRRGPRRPSSRELGERRQRSAAPDRRSKRRGGCARR